VSTRKPSNVDFDECVLRAELQKTGAGPWRCCVAWSGGLDSTVLLHAFVQLRRAQSQLQLRAIHVDHGLQAASRDFRLHCARVARALRVDLKVLRTKVVVAKGESVEEAARDARYALLAAELQPGEWLLTAQHADDQLETVLLALLRGGGPAGLAAMAPASPFAQGLLLRPLLNTSRRSLADYAALHQLQWVEDPSNQSSRFDRNYLRSAVLPGILQRWPAAARTVGRSARHFAQMASTQSQAAAQDVDLAADGEGLELAVLRRWSLPRRNQALREWLRRADVRMPGERALQALQQLCDVRVDASPSVPLPGVTIRRYQDRLLLWRNATQPLRAAVQWPTRRPLQLFDGASLRLVADRHGDVDADLLPARLWVRWQQTVGGRSLKKCFQELALPPWERERVPLVYGVSRGSVREALLAVGDLWRAPAVQADSKTRRRARFVWRDLR
jgi:tRNA(Ile)-lysidine synthase